MARRHLATNQRSLPFTLMYLFEGEGATARLVCATGVPEDHPAAPAVIDATASDRCWPAARLAEGASVTVEGIAERFPTLATGAWDEAPTQALLVPLPQQGQTRPYGVLVAGLNRYRPLDARYQGFINLVAGQIAAGIASAPTRRSGDARRPSPSWTGRRRHSSPTSATSFVRR